MMRGAAHAAALLALLLVAERCAGYPDMFIARHQHTGCTEHPTSLRRYARHGRNTPDRATAILVSQDSKAARVLCPGVLYDVKVTFPSPRLAMLTAGLATLESPSNASACPNLALTPRRMPVSSFTTQLTVACAAAGRRLEIKVTSAASRSSSFKFSRAVLPVDLATAPHCVEVSAECAPVRAASLREDASVAESTLARTFIPLTPSAMDVSRASARVTGEQDEPPEYAFAPVLREHKGLWQTLHALLMLLAFCVLLPLGTMLARHKWMFGRDDMTGRVMSSWGPVHVLCQVLGLLAAGAGVVIAILAFGWKRVPGQPLYLPHKWTGVGVMGMALVQLVLGMLRPESNSRPRACWNTLHRGWGRLTVMAGMGNCILGGLLIHDHKGDSYLFWLLPACVLVGLAGLAALTLEAFKMQMQRTHRYNHKTRNMLPVLEGRKRSKRRQQQGGGRGGAVPDASRHTFSSDDDDDGGGDAQAVVAADTYRPHDQQQQQQQQQQHGGPTLYPTITHRGSPVKLPRQYSIGIPPPRV